MYSYLNFTTVPGDNISQLVRDKYSSGSVEDVDFWVFEDESIKIY